MTLVGRCIPKKMRKTTTTKTGFWFSNSTGFPTGNKLKNGIDFQNFSGEVMSAVGLAVVRKDRSKKILCLWDLCRVSSFFLSDGQPTITF